MEELNTEDQDKSDDWLDQLNELIIDHLSDITLSNAWLAKQLLLSERSFYRHILDRTGLNPNMYIRIFRLLKAQELIESGTFNTVKEVSLAVGFRKTPYFSKLYKAEFGDYPIDLLKKNSH